MTTPLILYTTDVDIARITVNRPEVRNALNTPTRVEMEKALLEAEKDPAIRGIVITGAGEKAFVSGGDIAEMKDRDIAAALTPRIRLDLLIERLGKPVVAAVNGYALGGGCELAMACTVRVAAVTAKFGQPEINLGTIPGSGGTQRFSRLVGLGRAMQLVLTGEIIDAAEAYRIGLVNYVVPPEKVIPFSTEIARTLGSKPPIAWRAARDAVLHGFNMSLAEALEYEDKLFALCAGTEDKREGMAAFLEKRPPKFTGR